MNVKSGDKYTATIDGTDVEGKIQIESGIIYLCQNELDGHECEHKLGYTFSWRIRGGVENFNEYNLLKEVVTNFKLLLNRRNRIEKLEL